MVHRVAAQTIAARFKEIRAASAAGGGTALNTTLSVISIPLGSDWISVTATKLSGAEVVRFLLNPYLTIIQTTDALATTTNRTDLSKELQDGDAVDVQLDAMDTAANDNFIYVGADIQFRGANITVGGDPQNTGETLTVKYWEGDAWLDITVSDGSETGGATFAQDGNATWTVPDPWVKESLENIGDTSLLEPWAKLPLYWTRWEFSGTTEATWNVAAIRSLNRSTAYAELIDGQPYQQALTTSGPGTLVGVEALTDAGTAKVIVNVGTERGEVFE